MFILQPAPLLCSWTPKTISVREGEATVQPGEDSGVMGEEDGDSSIGRVDTRTREQEHPTSPRTQNKEGSFRGT